jgi:hypothetical protein
LSECLVSALLKTGLISPTPAVAGTLLPLGEFSMTRRVVGGAIAGFYFGLFPLGFRLLM